MFVVMVYWINVPIENIVQIHPFGNHKILIVMQIHMDTEYSLGNGDQVLV